MQRGEHEEMGSCIDGRAVGVTWLRDGERGGGGEDDVTIRRIE